MTLTIREAFEHAIKYEDAFPAYAILWATQQGTDLNSPYDVLIESGVNIQEVRQLAKNDPLGIFKVKLYTTQDIDGGFHLVLAENPVDAQTEILKRTGKLFKKFTNITKNIDEGLYDPQTRKFETIREIKNNVISFPHYIGIYDKE